MITFNYTEMFEALIESLDQQTQNITFAEVALFTYLIGSAYIAIAPIFLIPTAFLFGTLAIISIVIFACNIAISARVKSEVTTSMRLKINNLFANGANSFASFLGAENVAGKYNLNSNIAYSAITLVSMFIGINFLPVRLAAELLYLTTASYIFSIANNISLSPSRNIDCTTQITDEIEMRVLSDGILFDNNPVTAFRIYGCGTAQKVIESAIY